jgi:hypothetical protein
MAALGHLPANKPQRDAAQHDEQAGANRPAADYDCDGSVTTLTRRPPRSNFTYPSISAYMV